MNSQPRGLKRKSCDFRFLFIFNRLPLKNARDYLQHIFLLKIYGFVMHFFIDKNAKRQYIDFYQGNYCGYYSRVSLFFFIL